MSKFLKVKTADEVLEIIRHFASLSTEVIALEQAYGRVLATSVKAAENVPGFARATMDGYAVRAQDTFGATESLPALLEIGGSVSMGKASEHVLQPGKAVAIPTGGMLPSGADSVVMVEHTHPMDELTIEVTRPVAPGDNILTVGEDIAVNEQILPAGFRLRSQDLGVLAALGISAVQVYRTPRVAILSTGDEIVPITTSSLPMGKVRDINSYALAAQVQEAGCQFSLLGIVEDKLTTLVEACRSALDSHDVVLLSGGSSVGARDYTIQVIERLADAELLIHGVAIRPGKPTILARVGNKVFWGLPGQPVSAMIVFMAFVRPLLNRLQGRHDGHKFQDNTRSAVLTRRLPSVHGRADYQRVVLEEREGKLYARPIFGKSGMISTLARADGYVCIPEHSEGFDQGEIVTVVLFSG